MNALSNIYWDIIQCSSFHNQIDSVCGEEWLTKLLNGPDLWMMLFRFWFKWVQWRMIFIFRSVLLFCVELKRLIWDILFIHETRNIKEENNKKKETIFNLCTKPVCKNKCTKPAVCRIKLQIGSTIFTKFLLQNLDQGCYR